jgi:hypothetical protein
LYKIKSTVSVKLPDNRADFVVSPRQFCDFDGFRTENTCLPAALHPDATDAVSFRLHNDSAVVIMKKKLWRDPYEAL